MCRSVTNRCSRGLAALSQPRPLPGVMRQRSRVRPVRAEVRSSVRFTWPSADCQTDVVSRTGNVRDDLRVSFAEAMGSSSCAVAVSDPGEKAKSANSFGIAHIALAPRWDVVSSTQMSRMDRPGRALRRTRTAAISSW